jgi:hypothetical protein
MVNRTNASVASQAAIGLLEAILVIGVAAALILGISITSAGQPGAADSALAARGGGHGGGANVASTGGCVVVGTFVSGYGLPTDEVINFFVTDASGKTGWVLGFTDDGTWTEPVPAPAGPATYEFASRTWGPNGTHYSVFASCTSG